MIGHDNVGWAMLDGVLFYFFPFLFFWLGWQGGEGGGYVYYCTIVYCLSVL